MDDAGASAEWLRRALDDLDAARLLDERRLYALAAFHAQQAAEKALKSVLIAAGRGLARTHDLERLAADAKAPSLISDAAAFLTGFYVAGRYPDAAGAVEADDSRVAIVRAEEVVAWSRTQRS